MKHTLFISLFLLVLLGCNNQHQPQNADTVANVVTLQDDKRDVNHSCCFQTVEDFLPFFPDSSAEFRRDPYPRKSALKCVTDTTLVSFVMMSYKQDTNSIAVTLSDYCVLGNQKLHDDYLGMLLSYKEDKTFSEYNEFEVAGTYYGFACYAPNNRYALVMLVVDNRFVVRIEDWHATSSQSVLKMKERVPFKELAAFAK